MPTLEEVLSILASIQVPHTEPDSSEYWCAEKPFPAKDGWTVWVFYDCGEFDYIDSLTHPDHPKISYPFDPYQTEEGNPIRNWNPPD